jgi:hypothetical protein
MPNTFSLLYLLLLSRCLQMRWKLLPPNRCTLLPYWIRVTSMIAIRHAYWLLSAGLWFWKGWIVPTKDTRGALLQRPLQLAGITRESEKQQHQVQKQRRKRQSSRWRQWYKTVCLLKTGPRFETSLNLQPVSRCRYL